MSNELQKHKTGDKIKWILTLIAFILVGVMLTGAICGWFDKKQPSKDDTNIEQETPDTGKPDEGGTMITDVVAQSMSLMSARVLEEDYENYGVDALSVENVYTLSVTYTPADTTIKDTTYTIAFENPSSAWATGKTVTDYATITQSSAGSLDAVLTILQPFGERIIVTAQSDMTPEISTSVNVDYVKGVTLSTKNYTYKVTDDAFKSFVLQMVAANVDLVNMSVGTVDYTSLVPHCSYVMNEQIYDLLLPICQKMGIQSRLHQSVECATVGDGATLQNSTFMAFFDGGLTATERKYIMAQLAKACAGRTNINLYSIKLSGFDVYYNDVLTSSTSSNMTYAYQINNLNSYLTEATRLTPNVTDLIFSDNGLV